MRLLFMGLWLTFDLWLFHKPPVAVKRTVFSLHLGVGKYWLRFHW